MDQDVLATWSNGKGRRFPRTGGLPPPARSLAGLARRKHRWGLDSLQEKVRALGLIQPRTLTSVRAKGMSAAFQGGPTSLPAGWTRSSDRPLPGSWTRAGGALPTGRSPVQPAARAFKLALNNVNFYAEPRFGSVAAQLRDCEDLGVDIVRHPGKLQLFMDAFLPWDTVGSSKRPVIGPVSAAQVTVSALEAKLGESAAAANILDLARRMRSSGQTTKLIITFISLGAGARDPWSMPKGGGKSFPPSPTWDEEDSSGKTRTHANPLMVWWGADHVDAFDPFTDSVARFETDSAPEDWNKWTLDPANAYKRMVFHRAGVALGNWLKRNQAALEPYLAGIEICNEMEGLHTVEDGASGEVGGDGENWARFWFYVAQGIRRHCDWVPLWLPALASYAPDHVTKVGRWDGKAEYLFNMLVDLQDLCAEHGEDPEDLIAGMDYHYYHRRSSDRQTLFHIPAETRALRNVMSLAGLSHLSLTTIETSTNVVCSGRSATLTAASAPYPGGCEQSLAWNRSGVVYVEPIAATADWRPVLGSGESIRVNDFQGSMVWMRLALAAARTRDEGDALGGGADVVGWHPHMANNGTDYAGCGLRMDFSDADERAAVAFQRPSWMAYQRFGQILGGASGVELVWPRLGSALVEPTGTASVIADDATFQVGVVEFEGANLSGFGTSTHSSLKGFDSVGTWWAYQCFIDPLVALDGKAARVATATISFRVYGHRRPTIAGWLILSPNSSTPVGGPVSSGGYCEQIWDWGTSKLGSAAALADGLAPFIMKTVVHLGRYPVIFVADTRMAVFRMEIG